MYVALDGIRTEVDKEFQLFVKIDRFFGTDIFDSLLINKNQDEIIENEFTVELYENIKTKITDLSEDASKDDLSIKVENVEDFANNDIIIIKDFSYKIVNIDSDDNILYLDLPLFEDLDSGEDVYKLKYPTVNGLYIYKSKVPGIGNYVLNVFGTKYIEFNKYYNIDSYLNSKNYTISSAEIY